MKNYVVTLERRLGGGFMQKLIISIVSVGAEGKDYREAYEYAEERLGANWKAVGFRERKA